MIRKYFIPALAVIGVLWAIVFTLRADKVTPPAQPVTQPATTSFANYIAGSGIIEANTENMAIGTPIPGIVAQVFVSVGAQVKAGDSLFLIDDRETKAQLVLKESELEVARSAVIEAEANVADVENQLQIAETLTEKSFASKFDRDRKKYSVKVAQARLQAAKSGIKQAEAEVNWIKTNLDRLLVKAPVDGEILKLNVRLGEYAPAGTLKDPLVLMGNTTPLHVRVDIDENDAWRFKAGAKAEGTLRGNHEIKAALEFVRTEPYVLPKKSLTGDSAERVDTRVLQVIYRFDPKNIPAYVGQQMDVFIEAKGIDQK